MCFPRIHSGSLAVACTVWRLFGGHLWRNIKHLAIGLFFRSILRSQLPRPVLPLSRSLAQRKRLRMNNEDRDSEVGDPTYFSGSGTDEEDVPGGQRTPPDQQLALPPRAPPPTPASTALTPAVQSRAESPVRNDEASVAGPSTTSIAANGARTGSKPSDGHLLTHSIEMLKHSHCSS